MLSDEITKLENLCALDYLDCLNEETKEKLIGLCMGWNILSENEDETLSGETYGENYEEEEDEEEKEEEENDSILDNI